MSGSASFLGAKKSWVLSASFPRVAGEDIGGYWAPKNPCLLLRGAPQVSPEYGIYNFFAGAAAVTL